MHSRFLTRPLWASLVAIAFLTAVPTLLAQARTTTIDLNTATQAQLETLPGVGPATAKKIIDNRPYDSIDGLAKAGVPSSTIEKVRPLVKVGVVGKVTGTAGKGVDKGAGAIEKGAAAAARGVEKGVGAAATGVQKGAEATGDAAGKVRSKVTGTEPPEKGMVWVNTATGVYHKEGDRYYGKTKQGKWMTEAAAIKAGYHAVKPPKK